MSVRAQPILRACAVTHKRVGAGPGESSALHVRRATAATPENGGLAATVESAPPIESFRNFPQVCFVARSVGASTPAPFRLSCNTSATMAAPPAKHHYEYEFVDMRYNYDVNLLKKFYDELMVPNFGVRTPRSAGARSPGLIGNYRSSRTSWRTLRSGRSFWRSRTSLSSTSTS